MEDEIKPNSASGKFFTVSVVTPDPLEPDWLLPSDLDAQGESLDGVPSPVRGSGNSDGSKGIGEMPQLEDFEIIHKQAGAVSETFMNSEIESAILGIVTKIEIEISRLNSRGAQLFGGSRYQDAKDIAELGERMQEFCLRVRELKSEWNGISQKYPNVSEDSQIKHRPAISSDEKKIKHPTLILNSDRRQASGNLVVRIPNGGLIKGRTAEETFTEAIVYVGLEKVKDLGIEVKCEPLIAVRKFEDINYVLVAGYYVNIGASTSHKKKLLMQIAEKVGIVWTVEVLG